MGQGEKSCPRAFFAVISLQVRVFLRLTSNQNRLALRGGKGIQTGYPHGTVFREGKNRQREEDPFLMRATG